MNYFNDPDDYHIADAITKRLEELPAGTVTTIGNLFDAVAPGYEDEDVDLSAIDAQVRKMAIEKHISLVTLMEFREGAMGKPYNIPFKIVKR